jgi:DNA uptake protein ComE-like DNA-binding protein
MKNKKQGLTHSQIIGIIWLSIALLTVAGALFFYSHSGLPQTRTNLSDSTEMSFLTQKEDSVYLSRQKTHTNKYPSANYTKKEYSKAPQKTLDSTFYSNTSPTPRRKPLMVELNGADTLTLQLLHGIGPTYARRIVSYRERLGGFTSTNQLLEVYGFTPELLAHIEPHLTLDTTTIQRITINSIELKQLVKHPYIEYYQARDIVALRKLGTVFHTADDLRAVPSMADSTLNRLLPYIDFKTAPVTQ